MNVRDIKTKARSMIATNRSSIVMIFLFIGIMMVAINYLIQLIGSSIPFLITILGFLVLPFSHGKVVTALKTVNERSDELSIEQDGLVGIKRYKDLFFTYFIKELLLLFLLMLVLLIIALVSKLIIGDAAFNSIISFIMQSGFETTDISTILNDPKMVTMIENIGNIFFWGSIVLIVVLIMYSLYFALTPYLLEKYNIKGAKAMSESARLMKGHKSTLVVLYLSYIGWYFLAVLIMTVVTMIIPVPIIVDVLTTIVGVYLFTAELEVCKAVFFEEIDLEDKNQI